MKKVLSLLLIGIMVIGLMIFSPVNQTAKADPPPAPDLVGLMAGRTQFAIMPGGSISVDSLIYADRVAQIAQSQKGANFNLANFARPEYLQAVKDAGLRAIVKMTADTTDWHYGAGAGMMSLTDEQIQQKAQYMVDVSAPFDDIVDFYYIVDEPGQNKFSRMRFIKDTLHALNPNKPVFINLYPNYASASQLYGSTSTTYTYRNYLTDYQNIVGLDEFLRYDGFDIMWGHEGKVPERVTRYLENLIVVREYGLANHIPVWNTGSGCQLRQYNWWNSNPSNINKNGIIPPTLPSLYMQAYTTLAAGYKGMAWFTYAAALPTKATPSTRASVPYPVTAYDGYNDELTQAWRDLKEVNRQMQVVGDKMMSMKSTAVYFPTLGPYPESYDEPGVVELTVASGGDVLSNVVSANNVPLMVGEFIDSDSSRWFMVVNLSFGDNASVNISLQTPYTSAQTYSSASNKLKAVDISTAIELAPGMGQLFKVSP